jgi:methylenetetrahydrofolate dehydrogenase (NADP+)/methenyltetrahydrofolate cyclohydrolase
MATLINGKLLSEQLLVQQIKEAQVLKDSGINPGLAVVLVGEDPASAIYVRNKEKACKTIGIESKSFRLPENTTQQELVDLINRLNKDTSVHGILVQLPLPKHLDEAAVLKEIVPHKDVDGFHILNAGMLFRGQNSIVPCTPKGILYMLKSTGIQLEGKHAVIVNHSNVVGKPLAMLLLQENCTVTICHIYTKNLKEMTRQADILVVAIGNAKFFTGDMVKEGAVVVDVGINRLDGKVVGDVDMETVAPIASYITPVPGGVGKLTISMLMQNTLEAAWKAER